MKAGILHSEKMSFLKWCFRNSMEMLSVLLTAVLTVVVFLEVLFRYVVHVPLAWSEEFAMFVFQWCSFIGAAIAIRHRSHFSLDLVTKRLPDRWRTKTEIFSSVMIFFVAYLMIHQGLRVVLLTVTHEYSALRFPMAYGYLPIVVSGTLMIIYNIPIFLRQVRSLIERK